VGGGGGGGDERKKDALKDSITGKKNAGAGGEKKIDLCGSWAKNNENRAGKGSLKDDWKESKLN